MKSFYSHGKLLLTGEYFVLNGAKALALPTIPGQTLTITEPDSLTGHIKWTSTYANNIWFEAEFNVNLSGIVFSTDTEKGCFLLNMLKAAHKLNPGVLTNCDPLEVTANLEFDPLWGFGSSSSLINNVAKWFKINPFHLLWEISKGSGYDIACANANGPITYSVTDNEPLVEEIAFRPTFVENIVFIYLGKKQDTDVSIRSHAAKINEHPEYIKDISDITNSIVKSSSISEFNSLVDLHENILSKTLHIETLKNRHFSDFNGSIKSLGAWGGDFFMASSEKGSDYIVNYFKNLGFFVTFKYKDLIL